MLKAPFLWSLNARVTLLLILQLTALQVPYFRKLSALKGRWPLQFNFNWKGFVFRYRINFTWIKENSNFITLEFVLTLQMWRLVVKLPWLRIPKEGFFFIVRIFIVRDSIEALWFLVPSFFPLFPSLCLVFLKQLLRWPWKGSREGARCHCDRPSPWIFPQF